MLDQRARRRSAAGSSTRSWPSASRPRRPSMSTYARALTQRNSLLRRLREDVADRAELAYWDAVLVRQRRPHPRAGAARPWPTWPTPLAAAHREIAPGEPTLELRYVSNAAPRTGRGRAASAAAPAARDRREGDLERRHARRPASRRRRPRERRPRPRRLRVARPAAQRHPRAQARRARPPRRARRPTRRCCCSTTSSASSTPTGARTSCAASAACPRPSSRRRRRDDLDPALVARRSVWSVEPGMVRSASRERPRIAGWPGSPISRPGRAPRRERHPRRRPFRRVGDLLPALALPARASGGAPRRPRASRRGSASSRSRCPRLRGATALMAIRPPQCSCQRRGRRRRAGAPPASVRAARGIRARARRAAPRSSSRSSVGRPERGLRRQPR